MKKLDNMTDDEFMKHWTKCSNELDKAKEAVRACSEEYDRRLGEQAARDRLESMSDAERSALAQLFAVEGIESKEAVSNG